jgi:lipopolysaccharide/colanic/teichoic acid biosynthesis glycosyltransferase
LPTSPINTRRITARCRWKRALDLAIGVPLLLVLLPLIGLLTLLVRLDTPGPALYSQDRVGRDGRRFAMWKLRTMVEQADDGLHRAAAASWFRGRDDDGRFKSLSDPRITRVGRWLRRTNLDELPQLINVALGEMSLVGPRPAIPYELEHYEPEYFDRLRVPPGMTGLWQVSGREQLSAKQMMTLDREYVSQMSLWLDLRILALTLPVLAAGLTRGGA